MVYILSHVAILDLLMSSIGFLHWMYKRTAHQKVRGIDLLEIIWKSNPSRVLPVSPKIRWIYRLFFQPFSNTLWAYLFIYSAQRASFISYERRGKSLWLIETPSLVKLERSAGQDTLPRGHGLLGKWPVFKNFLEKDGKQMEAFSTLLFWYVNYFSAPEEVKIKNFRT